MRSIRFRAWNKAEKKMESVAAINWHRGIIEDVSTGGMGYGVSYHRPSGDYALMQFTGLLDKNGKEIYEGDIVSDGFHSGSPAKVVWDNARFELEYISTGDSGSITAFTEELEVIGNIHENPELLKAGGAE